MIKRTRLFGILLLALGLVGIAVGAQLWLIDSAQHYITITPVEGFMQYSLDGVAWYNITSTSGNTPWYSRLTVNYQGASRQVRVDWELWAAPGGWTTPLAFNTVVTLSPGWNTIYVTQSGAFENNYNWGQHTNPTEAFSYRVRASVSEV